MIYIFDIDGVVCETKNGEYKKSIPIKDNIGKINFLFKDHTIIFNTARGTKTGIDWENLTKQQFKKWGLKYHLILFQKPYGDFYIDDKAVNSKDFFRWHTRQTPNKLVERKKLHFHR